MLTNTYFVFMQLFNYLTKLIYNNFLRIRMKILKKIIVGLAL